MVMKRIKYLRLVIYVIKCIRTWDLEHILFSSWHSDESFVCRYFLPCILVSVSNREICNDNCAVEMQQT